MEVVVLGLKVIKIGICSSLPPTEEEKKMRKKKKIKDGRSK